MLATPLKLRQEKTEDKQGLGLRALRYATITPSLTTVAYAVAAKNCGGTSKQGSKVRFSERVFIDKNVL
jgi:hypothetical protein